MKLLSGWVKIHKIPHVIFETTSHFFFKLHSWEITLLYFFSWNFILFWWREPIKVPNFRLSISANLYLDRVLWLKVYKISAKNIQRTCVSWHWRLMQNLRKNDLLFQNWQEFDEFLSEHSKVSKIYTLVGPLREKYVMFDLKKYRGVILHGTDFWFGK